MRSRSAAPVLVISVGASLTALLDRADDRWLIALRNHSRRSWLTPLVDVRLWPSELGTLPVHVWPMTRRGLTLAAKDLAGVQGDAPALLKQRIASEGFVTQDGIERMKRLASLVPYPTMDLLEVLRFRFAPDVSDAVVVHLFAEAGSQTVPVLRLSDEELRRCVNAVRGETPRLEATVRRAIVETLRDSEPPVGSAAHLRWQAALSLQELVLADLQGADTTRPLATLHELGQGPTWEETRRATRLVPSAPALTDKIAAALGTGVGATDNGLPPPPVDQAAGRAWPWLWPGAREIVPAALVASLLVMAAGIGSVFGVGKGLGSSSPGQLLTITKPDGGTILSTGIICGTGGSACSANHPDGALVELRSMADPGYTFMGFLGDCAPLGKAEMTRPRICGAAFSLTREVVTNSGPGAPPLAATGQAVSGAPLPPTAKSGPQIAAPSDLPSQIAVGSARQDVVGTPPNGAATTAATAVETPGVPRRTGEASRDYLSRVQRIDVNLKAGLSALEKQDFANALARFRLVVREQPGYRGVDALIADTTMKQRAAFDQAMDAGQQNEQANRLREARQSYLRATGVDPNAVIARERNTALYNRMLPEGNRLLDSAALDAKAGRKEIAIRTYQQLLSTFLRGDEIRMQAARELEQLEAPTRPREITSEEAVANTQILEVLKAFCDAYAALDPNAVRLLWPTVAFDALQRQMKAYESAQCKFANPKSVSLDLKAGTARVEAEVQRGYVLNGMSKPETYEQNATLMLSRASTASPWLIGTVTYRPK